MKWKPKEDEKFYTFFKTAEGKFTIIKFLFWGAHPAHQNIIKQKMYWKTKKEAQTKLKQILESLKK